MKLYHGTTADALPDILKNGLTIETGGGNWNVSGAAVYFWCPKQLAEVGETETYEDACDMAERNAIESGEFGLAFSKDCRVVLLEVELDAEVFEVTPDESCEGMESSGAVCVFDDVPASCIQSIKISADLSLLRGYYLAMHLGREMSSHQHSMSKMETKIAKAFSTVEIYPEDVQEMRDMQNYPFHN